MNIITNIRQLKILVALSQLYVDNTEDQLVEMWLAKIAEIEGATRENTSKSLST